MRCYRFVFLLSLFCFCYLSYANLPMSILIDQGQEGEVRHANAQKVVISHQQIIQSGAKNIADILQQFSGIQIQDLVGDGSQLVVNIRVFGGNAAQNSLILIDGVPLSNSDMGTPAINLIPVEDIDHIDIIYGSEGTLYGNQAVGGVSEYYYAKK